MPVVSGYGKSLADYLKFTSKASANPINIRNDVLWKK